jgi:hypothetical protein
MTATATPGENRKALLRLVALLLALADLAERAGGRSGPVRHMVLWLLRSGEAIARDYVCGLIGHTACGPAASALPIAGEAGRLTASFRALAIALEAFSGTPMARRPSGTGRAVDAVLVTITALAAFAASPLAVERFDSS